jgi:hypothetical protein
MPFLIAGNARFEEPEDSPVQESAIAGKGEGRYYLIKSVSGQKNTKNFWWQQIPKTTAFNLFSDLRKRESKVLPNLRQKFAKFWKEKKATGRCAFCS